MWAKTSGSGAPRARSRPPARRNASGTTANSSSSDESPRNPSIEATSASVWGVYPLTTVPPMPTTPGRPARTAGRRPRARRGAGPGRRSRALGPGSTVVEGIEEGHGDPPAQHRREIAARHRADGGSRPPGRRRRRGGLAALGHEAPGACAAAYVPFTLEGAASPEVALVPAHHPAQSGLQGRDARAELVPVQRQAGLEAKGVACAEAGGRDAGVEDGLPEARGPRRPGRRTRRRPLRCSPFPPRTQSAPCHEKCVDREARAPRRRRGRPTPAGAAPRGPAPR